MTIFPIARRELRRWRRRAGTIPDPSLRRLAHHTLEHEGFNAEGAALFATLAPRSRRPAVVRLLVRFQVMYDYLDLLTEQRTQHPLATSRQLHLALLSALGTPPPTTTYYAHYPHQDDGGYLAALVASCRDTFKALPAATTIGPIALEAARRSSEGQSHSHAAIFTGNTELIAWATHNAAASRGLRWWETAAASESSLVIHALLASAAHRNLDRLAATRIAAAYWPWITGLNALLDDLVDSAEDAEQGTHSFIARYSTTEETAERLAMFATRASHELHRLPQHRTHAAILAAMTSFYLAAPGATAPTATPTAHRVREQLEFDLRLPLAMLRLRRALDR